MPNVKKALVLGAGGFIGSHMVNRLKSEGYWVRGVDLKRPEFSPTQANEFIVGDLRDADFVDRVVRFSGYQGGFYENVALKVLEPFDEVYQFAADMGGAGYVFTGDNDAEIMHNSATINLNVLDSVLRFNVVKGANQTKILYSSSACIYPTRNQTDPNNPLCAENSAYPADPDSEYGWEKLFSERLYLTYNRNYSIPVRIVRYHNIFGPEGTWNGGREKAPAAICRKVIEAHDGGSIEIWGSGEQTRSFLYIDECIEATRRLMESEFLGPINVGSEEMVTINQLADIAIAVSGKTLTKRHIDGPVGVMGRNSDNDLARDVLGWDYKMPLSEGIERTFNWIGHNANFTE